MIRKGKEENDSNSEVEGSKVKFDMYNVLQLFETLKNTLLFVYGMMGLDLYIQNRVYDIYKHEDEKLFRTTENATKLAIR